MSNGRIRELTKTKHFWLVSLTDFLKMPLKKSHFLIILKDLDIFEFLLVKPISHSLRMLNMIIIHLVMYFECY